MTSKVLLPATSGPVRIAVDDRKNFVIDLRSTAGYDNEADRWIITVRREPGHMILDLSGSERCGFPSRFKVIRDGMQLVEPGELLKEIESIEKDIEEKLENIMALKERARGQTKAQ